MNSSNVEVDILVNGRPVRKYAHQGKTFVKAEHWTEYSIRIRNNGHQRRLAVVCVDGINVLDGEVGGSSKNGYVVNGYSTYEVKGYRTSNEVVHQFKFNAKERSYAAKSDVTNGETKNCGVIGVEIYCEKETPQPQITIREVIREVEKPVPYPVSPTPWYPPYTIWCNSSSGGNIGASAISYTCSTNGLQNAGSSSLGSSSMPRAMNCSSSPESNANANVVTDWGSDTPRGLADDTVSCNFMAAAAAKQPKRGFDMGTEYSEKEVSDKVVDVEFEIGYLLTTFTFYYASKEALMEMGVPMTKEASVTFPEAFSAKFCRPPRK